MKRRDLVRHMQLKHSNGTKMDLQEDSHMTLLSSPSSSSSNGGEETAMEDDEDEETEVVDC
jgi:hypothetical protein